MTTSIRDSPRLPSAVGVALVSIALTLAFLLSKPFSLISDDVGVPGLGAIIVITGIATVLRFASAGFRDQALERRTIEILIYGWAVSLHAVAIIQIVV